MEGVLTVAMNNLEIKRKDRKKLFSLRSYREIDEKFNNFLTRKLRNFVRIKQTGIFSYFKKSTLLNI